MDEAESIDETVWSVDADEVYAHCGIDKDDYLLTRQRVLASLLSCLDIRWI